MKRIIPTIVVFYAFVLMLASCGKEPMSGSRGSNSPAIKLTVSGVSTKAKVITDQSKHSEDIYDYIETTGFNISAYVTASWERDVIGHSGTIDPGIFVDPGPYNPDGTYDITYPDENYKLKDVRVSYDGSRSDEKWRIAGNEDYANHKFSWVNGIPMNFFAYAPIPDNTVGGVDYSIKGTLNITKADESVDTNYPFTYTAKAVSDEVTSANCDDLIFAFTQHTAKFGDTQGAADYGKLVSGYDDKFDIKFHHALAQIRFCVDPADFPDTKLVYIKLFGPESTSTPSTYLGIPSSGSCTFAGASSTFTWSSLGNRYTYSQTFGASGVSFASGAPTNWDEDTYDTDKTLYTCVGDVFFVIPQSLGECAVEIKIQEGSNPAQILKGHLPATTSGSTDVSWEPGKYYTYKLNRGSIDLLLTGSLGPYMPDWF